LSLQSERSSLPHPQVGELVPLRPNTKDFGPRLGLAWAPAALHGKNSIRSGLGSYYSGNQNDDFSHCAWGK